MTVPVALLLAGCSGASTSPAASPDASPPVASPPASFPSASATVSVGREVPDAPEPPKARKGPVGQKAFARFVMDAWSWTLLSNDAGPLLAVSPSRKQPCAGCRPLARELASRDREGWYVDFPGLTVERIRLRRDGADVVASSKVAIPESDSYEEDGSYRSTSPAHDDASFTVTMRLVDDEYRLVSFSVR